MSNANLRHAQKAKNDEFYTQSSDIENELRHYTKHFKNKIVYCNCDDPTWSNFWHYFYRSFGYLGLKKLISTHYEMDGSSSSYALIYEGGHDNAESFDEGVVKVPLNGDGDFRSDECIEYLKESDIVVTNPPFSLAREYIKQLMDYEKKFLVIGNKNWINYKEVFPLLMNHKMWIGANNVKAFKQPDGSFKKFGNVGWFTNLSLQKSTDQMVIWKQFDQNEYPAYDNYPAFECSKVVNIPKNTEITATIDTNVVKGWQDFYKTDLTVISTDNEKTIVKIQSPVFGVPITILDKINPSSTIVQHNLAKEFDVIGKTDRQDLYLKHLKHYTKNETPKANDLNRGSALKIGNEYKATYARIFIRAKKGVKF